MKLITQSMPCIWPLFKTGFIHVCVIWSDIIWRESVILSNDWIFCTNKNGSVPSRTLEKMSYYIYYTHVTDKGDVFIFSGTTVNVKCLFQSYLFTVFCLHSSLLTVAEWGEIITKRNDILLVFFSLSPYNGTFYWKKSN